MWLHRFQAGSILIPRFGISYFCGRRILFLLFCLVSTKEFFSHCQCCLSQPRKTTSKTPFLRFKTQVKGMPTVLSQYHCVIEITLKIVLKIIKSSEPERNHYSKKLGRSMPRLLSQSLIVTILVNNDIVEMKSGPTLTAGLVVEYRALTNKVR